MGRSFKTKDAEDLIERQWKIKQYLSYVATIPEKYYAELKAAIDEAVMEEVIKVLCEVPVEEMGIAQHGFQLGALIDKGFHTAADVAAMDAEELASTCGINSTAALAMRSAADDVIATTKKWVKVTIDPDKKNDTSAKLLTAVSKYNQSIPIAENCRKLLEQYGSQIDSSIEQLDPSVSRVGWLFTSAKDRVKAEDAFIFLNDLFDGDYGRQAHDNLVKYESCRNSGASEAWAEYLLAGDKMISTLRKTAPELLIDRKG